MPEPERTALQRLAARAWKLAELGLADIVQRRHGYEDYAYTGTVRFQDGAVEIAVDLPKRVEWDQARLAALSEQIRAGGEDPGQYVEVSFKVSERAYTAWPERIRAAFEPARTVRTGRATYRLAIMSETARRDSPHAAGTIPMQGGR